MKILFLGGTKFFGKLIVKALVDVGHDVTLISRTRDDDSAAKLQIIGDRNDTKLLRSVQRHWDAVIDNIAYGPEDIKTLFKYITTDHYIVTSSIASYYPEVSEYSKRKLTLEKYLWKSDIPWTIMRPGIVYGPGDPTGKIVANAAAFVDYKNLSTSQISFVFSEDLVQPYLKIVEWGIDYKEKSFDLCHPQTLTNYWLTALSGIEFRQHKDLSGICPFHFEYDFIGHPAYAMEMLDWKPTPWTSAAEKTLPWIKEQLNEV